MYSIAASFFKPRKIVCIDIDEDALMVARHNMEHYHIQDKVEVVKGNLLNILKFIEQHEGEDKDE